MNNIAYNEGGLYGNLSQACSLGFLGCSWWNSSLCVVTSFAWQGNSLQAKQQLPSQLFSFVHLRTLDLTNYYGTGSIPTEIGYLTNLTSLVCPSQNQITGQIPTQIGNLANSLTAIDISNNALSGSIPTEIGLLTKVQLFRISDNNLHQLGTIPTQLCLLKSVITLDLSGGQYSGSLPMSNTRYFLTR